MNRYDYKNSIEYKKYCIKALLRIKKENLINEIEYTLNLLKDLFNFEAEIKEYYDLNIRLGDYMPKFYATRIYDSLNYNMNNFTDLNINMLNNALYYLNKTINAIEKKINDLYYNLI